MEGLSSRAECEVSDRMAHPGTQLKNSPSGCSWILEGGPSALASHQPPLATGFWEPNASVERGRSAALTDWKPSEDTRVGQDTLAPSRSFLPGTSRTNKCIKKKKKRALEGNLFMYLKDVL